VTAETRTNALTATNIVKILILFIDASYRARSRRERDHRIKGCKMRYVFARAFEVLGGDRGAVLTAEAHQAGCEAVRAPTRPPSGGAMRSLVAMTIIVAVATPAGAQISPNIMGEMPKFKTDVEVKQEQERESGYKAGLGKIPDQKAKVDPWGNVRGAATPQSNQSQQRPASK
jgi:hypothetical protein